MSPMSQSGQDEPRCSNRGPLAETGVALAPSRQRVWSIVDMWSIILISLGGFATGRCARSEAA